MGFGKVQKFLGAEFSNNLFNREEGSHILGWVGFPEGDAVTGLNKPGWHSSGHHKIASERSNLSFLHVLLQCAILG